VHVRRTGGIATVLAAVLGLVGVVAGASAAGDTLRIEPASTTVAKDATFTARVVQDAEVATSGAQATITFDPTLLQIMSVTRGAPFADAPVFVAGDATAIAGANKSGKLAQVAAAFLPPGSVPPGDADFLVVEFKAVGCGRSDLGLPVGPGDASLIDGSAATYGSNLTVSTSGGTVTTCSAGGAAVASSASPATTPAADSSGGPPLLSVVFAVVAVIAIACAMAWWMRRSRAAQP